MNTYLRVTDTQKYFISLVSKNEQNCYWKGDVSKVAHK